jgi:ABC-type branched-subunit amino acid transport system ATPase component
MVGLAWLAIVVTFGVRRPGGALLAGLATTCGAALFHLLGTALPGGTINDLVTSDYFVPILSGIGAIQLAQEPDGILALVGHERLAKRRAKEARAPRGTESARVEAGAAAEPVVDDAALELRGIVAGYGDAEVLHGVDLVLRPRTVTALLGANGAGKSTLCAVAAGVVTPTAGAVRLADRDVTSAPSFQRVHGGVLFVPEARGVFPGLSVEDNLALLLRDEEARDLAYARFPVLGDRRRHAAGLLSGGEQQMLGLVPALVAPPTVLIADEPTLGLAPLLADIVMDAILEVRERGAAVLLVEEHAQNAFTVADRVAFMELGRITWAGPTADADLDLLRSAYLGRAVDELGGV